MRTRPRLVASVSPRRQARRPPSRWPGLALAAICGFCAPAAADKISHPTATFEGLDKITGRTISFDVAIDETVQFGSLQITPRVCYSRPLTEAPRTDAFAEVDEIDDQKKLKPIFSGWMFADSPGLHAVEHPVYDVWLTDCKGDGKLIHEAPEVTEAARRLRFPTPTSACPTSPPATPRRRFPRRRRNASRRLRPPKARRSTSGLRPAPPRRQARRARSRRASSRRGNSSPPKPTRRSRPPNVGQ